MYDWLQGSIEKSCILLYLVQIENDKIRFFKKKIDYRKKYNNVKLVGKEVFLTSMPSLTYFISPIFHPN